MTKTYVRVLKESLCRKKEILKELLDNTAKQLEVASLEKPDWESFDDYTQKKGILIEELEQLDEGFDLVFERVKAELEQNKENYQDEIIFMKKLILEITSLSASLEVSERRNKMEIEAIFSKARKEIRQKKSSAKAVTTYYQNAKQYNLVDPQLLDKKN